MERIVILCADEMYQHQLRNVLSLGGLRVTGCKTLNECLEIHATKSCDLTLMITDHQTTNHQILWFLEEMKVNGNNSPLWAVTTQTSILDEHRVIRRDVILLHPDDVTPESLAQALVNWRSSYEPLTIALSDVLQAAESIRLSGLLDVEVDGQSLGQLHFQQGHLIYANGPGLRGSSALNFFSTLELADIYIRDADPRISNTATIHWRSTLNAPDAPDPRKREVLADMLNDGYLCLGNVGQVYKWKPGLASRHHDDQAATPPPPVVMREYNLRNESPTWIPSGLGDQSTDSFSDPAIHLEEIAGPTRPEVVIPPAQQKVVPKPKTPPPPDDGYDILFKEATLAYVRRDYRSAMALFEQCLEQRPDDRRAQHNLNQIKQRTEG